jgi:phosphoribosylamine--glycine ligase
LKILVVGGGGREHALCWAVSKSADVFCAPGNPGTATLGTNLPVKDSDLGGIVSAVAEHKIDLTIIGPEVPLAAGLADRLLDAGHYVFGPRAAAAQIEASKAFSKQVMEQAGVPTACGGAFRDEDQALNYLMSVDDEPMVVKASGLAAGKGVLICENRAEAEVAVREMFAGKFGAAGEEVIIEECLQGEELSVLALTDGEQSLLLPASQDHKRIGEGDTGLNTGGMGAYSPVSVANRVLLGRVRDEIISPTLAHLAETGAPYKGVLYAGLMISASGDLNVLEFNCRFGDPEAQVVLPVLNGDILEHMWQIAAGENWRPGDTLAPANGCAVTTVLASRGYPASPETGVKISIPTDLPPDTVLFHAGTTRDSDGVLRTSGGRVLCATGLGPDVPTAVRNSRELAESIEFESKVFRRDIAWREVARAGTA